MPNPLGPPRLPTHVGCGGAVTMEPICEHHGVIPSGEIEILPGPGLTRMPE